MNMITGPIARTPSHVLVLACTSSLSLPAWSFPSNTKPETSRGQRPHTTGLSHQTIDNYNLTNIHCWIQMRHSAKAKLHSAKPLPSAALAKTTRQNIDRQNSLCRVPYIGHSAKALPSATGTLGKEKWLSRHRPRWRSLCRVPTLQALGKDFFFFKNFFAECSMAGTRQRCFIFFFKNFFAECLLASTRQGWSTHIAWYHATLHFSIA
jgi:hypothetical protein